MSKVLWLFFFMVMTPAASGSEIIPIVADLKFEEQNGDTRTEYNGKYYRDSQGRLRQESKGVVHIFDPVDQIHWEINVNLNVALRQEYLQQMSEQVLQRDRGIDARQSERCGGGHAPQSNTSRTVSG